jgi:ketosteroid isomerase-like protein
MDKLILVPASVALALTLASCDRAATPADGNAVATAEQATSDAEAVRQDFAAFNADIAAKNLDAIKAHYASDAVMVIPDRPPFEGIEAIMGDYKAYAADPVGKYVPGAESTSVSSGGDLAYGQVTYQSTFTNSKTKAVETAARYNIVIYKKQPDGSWKVIRDINAPLPKAG